MAKTTLPVPDIKKEPLEAIPTVLVVFGATGDLMAKKIVPALFHLYQKEKLPKLLRIVGFSRRDFGDEGFSQHVGKILSQHKDIKEEKEKASFFLKLFSYQKGVFKDKKGYQKLAILLGQIDGQWQVCANKLFYIAAPPPNYETIFKNLAASGLTIPCSPEEGWTRVIVEKPFGRDLATAQKLDALLGRLFREEQLYRIDHYLAKEMLQNILAFRFANNLFEPIWNNKFVEKMEIRLLEKGGVEDRGAFYDSVGALRDVGQNHLLQMLALTAMEHPVKFEADSIREKRSRLLGSLKKPSEADIQRGSFRAQYDGFRRIKGVRSNSATETYFKAHAELDHPRWQGVPITLEAGKRMKQQVKEVMVTFRHFTPCLCPPGKHFQNRVVFALEPKEEIRVELLAKKPGFEMEVKKRVFDLPYRRRQDKAQYTEEYEKLLLDCIAGDQTLFVSTAEVEAMWRYIDPILGVWEKGEVPLKTYKPGTEEASKKATLYEKVEFEFKKEIGIVGLGKMGANLSRQLVEKGWRVVGYNRTREVTQKLAEEGVDGAYSYQELAEKLSSPRLVWLMLPAGKAVDDAIDKLLGYLDKKDIIIDGGNSFYKDSVRRSRKLSKKGIEFADVGVSGGPSGARHGASLMVGGRRENYDYLLPLFVDLAVPQGVAFFEGAGAGHFVKMVHNGIEYGLMQAIAEGFTILKDAKYKLNLEEVASVYNHGSVVESRLVGWLKSAFELHGQDLRGVSGSVGHTGEGAWTVETAKEMGIETKIIEQALKFRIESEKRPSYTGKILSALREQFGGHSVTIK